MYGGKSADVDGPTGASIVRVIFMGTPEFSVGALTEIVAAGHDVAAVYTQPPRPAGRGQTVRKSPVHMQAEALGLAVRTPERLRNDDEHAAFAALDADVAVVAAYGLILPPPILEAPRWGCLNLHASLLPRWRGAAPIQRAIMAGDTQTGVQVMQMEEGLDTGPILLSETTTIGDGETAGALHDRLSLIAAQLAPRALAALARGSLAPTPQSSEGVVYAPKIDKAEARIDWMQPAITVTRQIRGLSPFPGAWCEMPRGTDGRTSRLKVLNAQIVTKHGSPIVSRATPGDVLDEALLIACGEGGAVRLTRLQREGKTPQSASEFLNGVTLSPNARLV